jgi:hypothetical protein
MNSETAATTTRKPFAGKAFGSTPHLPNSRLGLGDWSCNDGQAKICTERARDQRDVIYVSEKLDGSCCAVGNVEGNVLALVRAGYLATTSPYEQHHRFADWVAARRSRFQSILKPGQRIAGEWLLQAHGCRYRIDRPDELFVPFAVFDGKKRQPFATVQTLADRAGLVPAHLISAGPPCSVEAAMEILGANGHHKCDELPEGAVWVVERDGVFEFTAKFVRPDKVDGKLLPEISGGPEILNWTGSLMATEQRM